MAVEATNIPDLIAVAAREFPQTRVVVHSAIRPDESTLDELWCESVSVAAGLRAAGIVPGDVVAAQLPNWRECFTVHAATWLCGATLLPIVPIYGPREIEFILRQSGARAFFVAGDWRGRTAASMFEAMGALPALAHRVVVGGPGGRAASYAEFAGYRGEFDPHIPARPNERALLVYTSGTTGNPKGVQHTHASLLAEVHAMNEMRGSGPDITHLAAFPSGHIAGVLGVLRMLGRGTLTVAMDAWNPDDAARLIVEHQVSASGGAPIHLDGIMAAAARRGLDVSCLGEYTTGAANVSPDLIIRADAMGIKAFRCYGSTEHPTVSSGRPDDPLQKRAETDGRLCPGTEIRLVDDAGRDVPPGVDGEILSRGPELFAGYAGFVPGSHGVVDGWFRTGDIGRLDAEGYLRVTDRKKDIIVRGGENISSKEVEDVLLAHPAISEAAAIGAADERYGERVCAFVVLRDGHGIDIDQVRAHFAASGLARQKTPERLEVVTELPRTASGKVQKQILRGRLA